MSNTTISEESMNKLVEKIVKAIEKGMIQGFDGIDIKQYLDKDKNLKDKDKLENEIKSRFEANRISKISNLEAKKTKLENEGDKGDRKTQKAIDRINKEIEKLNKGKDIADDVNKQYFTKIGNVVDKWCQGIQSATQILSGAVDLQLAIGKSGLQKQKNLFEKSQKTFQANMEMSNVVASNVVTSIKSFATQTATEAGRSLAAGAKEEANARIKQIAAIEMAIREFANAEEQRELDRNRAEAAAASSMAQGVAGIASLFGPVGMIVGAVINTVNSVVQTGVESVQKFKEFNLEKSKQEAEVYKTMMDNFGAIAEKVKKVVDGIDDTANSIADYVRQSDTVYKNTGLAFGWSGDKFASLMRKTAIETAKIFGTTAEEMKAMQEGFINNSSRAIMLNGDEFNQMTAISKTFGISQGEVAGIMGTMNLFNISVDEGYDKFNAMYHTITKMGLSTTKFAKDLNNNLKLAQKYNFKGGVENMMKMTQWAQQTRFNLNNAVSFADKLSNGSLSDVLESSAKLQVLGGAAGMYSDPLAMMYEAGADVGALAKRQAAMFNDITGTFNAKTGETEFNWYENRMLAARAQAMGMDVGEVKDMIRQNQRQGVINKKLNGFGLSEEDKLAIGNRAQYKNGEWMVNTRNGEMSIQDLANLDKDVREQILLPENQQEAIMEIAEHTRSIDEREKANLATKQASLGSEAYDSVKEASNILIQAQNDLFKSPKFREAIKDSIKEQAKLAKEEMENTVKFLDEHKDAIDYYRKFVSNQLGLSNAIGKQEVAILRTMSTREGLTDLSNFAGAVAKLSIIDTTTDKGDKEFKELLKELKKDKRIAAMLDKWVESGKTADVNDIFDSFNSPDSNSINDGYIKPNGESQNYVVKNGIRTNIAPRDTVWAAQPGGDFSQGLNQLLSAVEMLTNNSQRNGFGNVGELKITFGGSVRVEQDGSITSINLNDIANANPSQTTQFVQSVLSIYEASKSGKHA